MTSAVHLQPACLFSIFDQFQRRGELCTGRLIGAIYGTRVAVSKDDGSECESISIKQAFPIPHSELQGQVNINNDYYKSRAELIRTCYGRSQYILGWYSIRTTEQAEVNPSATAFIHDVFCKEIMKSSPITAPNAALHLEVVVNTGDWTVSVQLNGQECPVSYAALEDVALLTSDSEIPSPSAVIKSLRELKSPEAEALLQRLPEASAYARQSSQFGADISGLRELLGVFSEQLSAAHKLYSKQ